jgi:hypothetical protein
MLSEVLRAELLGRRLLATDLDGTLLRSDLSVSPLTRRAIAEATAAGIRVVFVTGRPPRWMRAVASETGHAGTAICANGAVLLDLTGERVHSRTTIDVEAAAEVARGLRLRYGPAVHFAVERVAVGPMPPAGKSGEFALEQEYHGSLPVPAGAPRMPLEQLLELPDLVKLLARLEYDDESFWPHAQELSAGRLEVTHSTKRTLLELGPAGVTKATALAALVADFGLTQRDVVAVGDMPNDVPMLDWAGIGLAIVDGHDSAKSVAAHHVPSPEFDGVGLVLRAMAGLEA